MTGRTTHLDDIGGVQPVRFDPWLVLCSDGEQLPKTRRRVQSQAIERSELPQTQLVEMLVPWISAFISLMRSTVDKALTQARRG